MIVYCTILFGRFPTKLNSLVLGLQKRNHWKSLLFKLFLQLLLAYNISINRKNHWRLGAFSFNLHLELFVQNNRNITQFFSNIQTSLFICITLLSTSVPAVRILKSLKIIYNPNRKFTLFFGKIWNKLYLEVIMTNHRNILIEQNLQLSIVKCHSFTYYLLVLQAFHFLFGTLLVDWKNVNRILLDLHQMF